MNVGLCLMSNIVARCIVIDSGLLINCVLDMPRTI